MTREEALDLISDVEKFYCESADEYGYYCYEAESVIDKIYDSFEEAMKPKTCKCCLFAKVTISSVICGKNGTYKEIDDYCKYYKSKDTQC